jgi:predicted naringenin-chalcone synthase
MTVAHINRIGVAVPEHDVHAPFIAFARTLLPDDKARNLFDRMAERAGIGHRWSALQPGRLDQGEVDADGFYRRGAFPGTAARMRLYETQALALALQAVHNLAIDAERHRITHLVVASCTGFTAPGLDLQLAAALGLRADVERTVIGFMGCSAAVPALRMARHTVRSDPVARVLVVNLELCSLHMQETPDMEKVLSFLLFGDGCAAALVSTDPCGIALGYDMYLSGKVPGRIAQALRQERTEATPGGVLQGEPAESYGLWAVHAGGRTVLDAVEAGLELHPSALLPSRGVLHDYGNMSSATVMFVLQRLILAEPVQRNQRGLAMAFGPGMVAETFRFSLAPG